MKYTPDLDWDTVDWDDYDKVAENHPLQRCIVCTNREFAMGKAEMVGAEEFMLPHQCTKCGAEYIDIFIFNGTYHKK